MTIKECPEISHADPPSISPPTKSITYKKHVFDLGCEGEGDLKEIRRCKGARRELLQGTPHPDDILSSIFNLFAYNDPGTGKLKGEGDGRLPGDESHRPPEGDEGEEVQIRDFTHTTQTKQPDLLEGERKKRNSVN